MTQDLLKNKFEIKELELNSLLEITQAINNNLPEASLYKIYHFILRANHNIKRLALYVLDEQWECKAFHGTDHDYTAIPLDENFLPLRQVQYLQHEDRSVYFGEFDILIPIAHKDRLLAFVFIEGIKGEEDELQEDVTFIQALSNIILVAIENKKFARNELMQEALRKEMEIARNVQKFLFPEILPYEKELMIEASYLPHHTIGGDYYDYIPINKHQFLLCIADVSGKGIPAAIIMSNFQASLRALIRQTPNISTIVRELNFLIQNNNKGENFITFFGAIYDSSLKTMVYVNSGHNPPILIDKNQEIIRLDLGTTILGSFKELPFVNEGFLTNLDEFLFFAFTDGITETQNIEEEEYGDERLLELLKDHPGKDLKALHKLVIDDLDNFKGEKPYNDDITMLSCRVVG